MERADCLISRMWIIDGVSRLAGWCFIMELSTRIHFIVFPPFRIVFGTQMFPISCV